MAEGVGVAGPQQQLAVLKCTSKRPEFAIATGPVNLVHSESLMLTTKSECIYNSVTCMHGR